MIRFLILMLAAATACGCHAECRDAKIETIGQYHNMETSDGEDPHLVSGYSVRLYRCGKELFGDLEVAVGSTEAVSGQLFDIAYDPKSRHIQFKAKYVSGQEYSKATGPGGREARQLLSFSGVMGPRLLKGTFRRRSAYGPEERIEISHEVMKRARGHDGPKNFAEWESYQAPIPTW